MAKQKGLIKIQGSIGDLTFAKTVDGYKVRARTTLDGKRIAKDPAFKRTRENGEEFGRAGKASKLMRNALRMHIRGKGDSRLVSRMVQAMMRVIKSDTVSLRGKRNVMDGNTELLQGFELNGASNLSAVFTAPYTSVIDRAAGNATIDIAGFIPLAMINAPSGATHFRVKAALAEVDFLTEKYNSQATETAELPWENSPVAPIQLSVSLGTAATQPLFLVLGVEFMQQVNGQTYELLEGRVNAMAIIGVDKP